MGIYRDSNVWICRYPSISCSTCFSSLSSLIRLFPHLLNAWSNTSAIYHGFKQQALTFPSYLNSTSESSLHALVHHGKCQICTNPFTRLYGPCHKHELPDIKYPRLLCNNKSVWGCGTKLQRALQKIYRRPRYCPYSSRTKVLVDWKVGAPTEWFLTLAYWTIILLVLFSSMRCPWLSGKTSCPSSCRVMLCNTPSFLLRNSQSR